MKITNNFADAAVLQLIGEGISRYRLNRNLTQTQLADDAGVSLSTLNRMESGSSSQINNFVRVLRA
jgi:transcriptional regulator with XRE-family HTH domain